MQPMQSNWCSNGGLVVSNRGACTLGRPSQFALQQMESNLKGFIWLELGLFLLQSIFFLLLYLKLTNCVCSIGCCLVSMMSHKDLMQKFLFMLVMYMKDLTFFLVKEFHVHRQCLPVCIWCTLHVPHSTRDVPTISPVPSLAEQTRGCAEMYRDAQAG